MFLPDRSSSSRSRQMATLCDTIISQFPFFRTLWMPRNSSSIQFIALLFCLFFATSSPAAESIDVSWDKLRDVENEPVSVSGAKWKVVCFLGAECPLARLYGPRLQRLSEEFSKDGVQVVGVNSNPQDSLDDIKRYIKDHGVSFPIIKDQRQSLARMFGARRTPEVFVLDASGHVRYQGRIDDQYGPGTARAKPSRHDLRNALEALIAGREGFNAKTKAVGCLITMLSSRSGRLIPLPSSPSRVMWPRY